MNRGDEGEGGREGWSNSETSYTVITPLWVNEAKPLWNMRRFLGRCVYVRACVCVCVCVFAGSTCVRVGVYVYARSQGRMRVYGACVPKMIRGVNW